MQASDLLGALLGAGGVAFVTACFKGFRDLRDGSARRRKEAIEDIQNWRREADDAREWESKQHWWWRDWAGKLEYRLTSRGIPLPEKEPYPTRPQGDDRKKEKTDG